ncbi:AAA family ATPase [Sandaracinobacter neustonicus]|uniref:AAA family ATPase n=1 Tax=Sandaracinobacter neustonicus TaxID=1715348 RepID=A0A501XE40_9SPHN|nr:ATP-binding protein [Sandaracinobacter neustonicus]TPE58554.1 AAA family ATPase [Sandaracinobacter neustonicus]
MNQTDIFDSETVVPDAGLAQRAGTLLGFQERYARVHDQLRLLLAADKLGDWSQRHHSRPLAITHLVADQYPLVVFHGDVGTGKTAMAECIANRLLSEARSEDATIFRLSNRVRGSGKVGEMTTLLAEALKRVTTSVGKTRRAVLVIDEGDSIAAARTQEHSHHEDKVAVNTLIQGIDDLRRYKGRIVVILCTNRLSVLDPALLRRAAIVDRFDRPTDVERRALLEMDLDGLDITPAQIGELVELTGPIQAKPGWTYSDFRTRFYPAAMAKAFPDGPLRYEHLRAAATEMAGSRVMDDR